MLGPDGRGAALNDKVRRHFRRAVPRAIPDIMDGVAINADMVLVQGSSETVG